MSITLNPVLPVTLADLQEPSDDLRTDVRIYLQDKRFDYYRRVMLERHNVVIRRASEDDDIENGIDGWTLEGGVWIPIQDKERFRDRDGRPYRDAEYEYRRNIDLPESDYWHWGREWRNRGKKIKYYDLTTQDGWRRRFLMADINRIAQQAHESVLDMAEIIGKDALLGHGCGGIRWKGWELKAHTDRRGGHRKLLLYIRWYEEYGKKPPITPIEEWKVD